MMKILLVIDSLGSGGAQRQMVNLAREIKSCGHSPSLFLYQEINHFLPLIKRDGIPVHQYQKKHRFSLGVISALAKQLARNNYDVALAFLPTPSVYLEVASQFSNKTKTVVSERSVFRHTGRFPLKTRLFQNLHRLADHITVNSFHQRDNMTAEFGWMKPRISTILNGVDLSTFVPRPNSNDSRHVRLIAVGTVIEYKNAHTLIEALHLVRQTGRRVSIDWVGRTAKPNEDYFPSLNRRINELGLTEDWNWLGERSNIAELLPNYDGLVHPSTIEGCSNAICEALACGLPVLTGRIADHAFLLDNERNGLLFDITDAASLADAIKRFSELNPDAQTQMGSNARKFAESNLSMDKFVSGYINLFEHLVASS